MGIAPIVMVYIYYILDLYPGGGDGVGRGRGVTQPLTGILTHVNQPPKLTLMTNLHMGDFVLTAFLPEISTQNGVIMLGGRPQQDSQYCSSEMASYDQTPFGAFRVPAIISSLADVVQHY